MSIIWQNGGQKHKIINFEDNFPFGTLYIHKWTENVIVQVRQYPNVLCKVSIGRRKAVKRATIWVKWR